MKYVDKLSLVYTVTYDVHTIRENCGFFTKECDKRKTVQNSFYSERKLKKFLKNWDYTEHCNCLTDRIENFKVVVQCRNDLDKNTMEYLPMNIVFGNGTKQDTKFTTVYTVK